GLVIPPLPQLLLTAVLRVFAMLVSNVVSTFQMRARRLPVIGTRMMPDALPRVKTDTIKDPAAANHRSPIALILSSARSARPSKDEGVLTTLSHTSSSPSVSRAAHAIHLPLLRMGRQTTGALPPSVRSTGGGGVRALARMTEGAHPRRPL
ncbi:MAG: hypothetical protein Q8R82_20240, partial [Hyphomonadaceae bacterium]|nr:hypothetical protein [Hyphomonadaceae bacterium]